MSELNILLTSNTKSKNSNFNKRRRKNLAKTHNKENKRTKILGYYVSY